MVDSVENNDKIFIRHLSTHYRVAQTTALICLNMAKTRSAVSVWLIGMPNENILGSGLPTNGSILRNFLFHHQERGMTIADSAKATIHATLVIWAKAHIPTQRIDSCVRKLRKLYDDYSDLKRNRLTQKDRDDDFAGMPLGLRQEMILFYTSAIRDRNPREDYRELLQLCLIFLGGEVDGKLFFRAPGAMQNARWMSKTI